MGRAKSSRGEWQRRAAHGLCSALFFSSTLGGCARQKSEVPEWPRQPSPSYPAPAGAEAKPEPSPQTTVDEVVEAPAPLSRGSELAKKYHDAKAKKTLRGKATYYADSLAGNHTANGDLYDPKLFTAAHKKLPFGTIVRVVRTDTDQETYVRINDRGPFGSADRIIDLSRAAAEEVDMMKAGVVPVRVEVVEQPQN